MEFMLAHMCLCEYSIGTFKIELNFVLLLKMSGKGYVVIEYPQGALSGGLGDRVVGLTGAIVLAKMLRKPLLIKWDSPSISGVFSLGLYNYYASKPSLAGAVQLFIVDKVAKFHNMFARENLRQKWMNKTILIRANQDFAFSVYSNPTWKDDRPASFEEMMLDAYADVFAKYLKPALGWSPPAQNYMAIQIRTGDVYMKVGSHQPIKDVPQAMKLLGTQIRAYYEKNLTTEQNKILYVSSDNTNVKNLLAKELPEFRVIENANSHTHFERSRSAPVSSLRALVQDLMSLINAPTLIVSSYSNFGRLAALMGGKKRRVAMGFVPPHCTLTSVTMRYLMSGKPGVGSGSTSTRRTVHKRVNAGKGANVARKPIPTLKPKPVTTTTKPIIVKITTKPIVVKTVTKPVIVTKSAAKPVIRSTKPTRPILRKTRFVKTRQ